MPADVKRILSGVTAAAVLSDNCAGKEMAQQAGQGKADEQEINQTQRKRQDCRQNQAITENSCHKGSEGTTYTQCQGQAQGGAKICTGRKDSVQVGRGQKCYQKYRGAKHERKEQQRIFSSITQIEPSAVTRKEQGNGHQKK